MEYHNKNLLRMYLESRRERKCRNYTELLIYISENQKKISDPAEVFGCSSYVMSNRITFLKNRGFVHKLFAGNSRYIILTDGGKKFVSDLIKQRK